MHLKHKIKVNPGLKVKLVWLLFLTLSLNTFAQKSTITGTVTGLEDNMPIPGVAVLLQGVVRGVITDFDGNFSIQANIGDVLKFSYIGMQDKTLKLTKNHVIIKLATSVEDLEEVVVIGYGTQKKKEVTGAVARLKSEDITNVVTSDLSSAMQGQIAGVNVIASSGEPGSEAQILIRGIASITGSNTPLYVVDGIPQEGDPGLSPNEIDTIDVLKDAASAAIYGTRGTAGVILITTKKGEAGSVRVNLNSSYGVQYITSGIELMNAIEQNYFDIVQQRVLGLVPSDDAGIVNATRSQYGLKNDTSLLDFIFNDYAPSQNHTVNISGGTEALRMSFTAGFFNQEGIIINSKFKRLNSRFNVDYNKGKWNISANLATTFEKRDIVSSNIYTRAINYRPSQEPINPSSTDDVESTSNGPNVVRVNGVLSAFNQENIAKRRKIALNARIAYKVTDELTLSTRLGITDRFDYARRFNPNRRIIDFETGEVISNPTNSGVRNNAALREAYSLDVSANYVKKINDHKVTFTGALSYEKYINEQFEASKISVANNDIKVLNGALLSPNVASGTDYTDVLIGSIFRAQYAYKDKYLLSSSVRRDATSKFAEGNRKGMFPSISVGWNVSEEPFWEKHKKAINNFKVRASRGTTGTSSIPSYSSVASITQNLDYIFGVTGGGEALASGAIQTAFANKNLKWETSIQKNIGVDFAFFKNKLTLTMDYYSTDKEDMLFNVTIPASAGGGINDDVVLNVGNMTNEGFEAAFGYRDRAGAFNWRVNSTFSTNKNTVTKVNNDAPFTLFDNGTLTGGAAENSRTTALAVGYEAGAYFLRTTNGIIDTNQKLADYQKIDPTARMGDLIFNDNNNDGQISDDDRVYSGSGLPEYEIGFNFNGSYKDFDISMQWYSALGHEILNGSKASAYSDGRSRDLIYAWSEANPVTTIPRYFNDQDKDENYRGYSDLWLEDGSYLRLKQITLGYTLPKKLIEKLNFSKIRFYVSAQNPITLTNYTGFDPEVGGSIQTRGLDKGRYPITATYLAGVNFNL